jgi:uncharacterized protein YceH (UPF0502 family)
LELNLDAAEKRVLGSLMEKEMTTPDYYPLTLNALMAACNQKSNREPVMELDEDALRAALHGLEEKHLAAPSRGEGRVARFEHRIGELWNLGRRESAVLCTLLLRGAQTPGELRGRSERMHPLEDLDQVQAVLQKLMEHDPPLARLLPRQPGTKESRYADRMGGEEEVAASAAAVDPPGGEVSCSPERVVALEAEVARLRGEVEDLRRQWAEFRAQFKG